MNPDIFVITDRDILSDAIISFRSGAKDYINKKQINELLIPQIKQILRKFPDSFPVLFARNSDACLRAYSLAHMVAKTDLNILIYGENGIGKEPLAQEIYETSLRNGKSYTTIDCGTIQYLAAMQDLKTPQASICLLNVVSELFVNNNGGTIILDNLQLLSLDMQSIILHVLCDKRLNIRIIATADTNLHEMVISGGFRSALYYKIKEFTTRLPSLRECQNDIMLLANFYLNHYNNEFGKDVKRFDYNAQKEMLGHSWPGNIRELKHVIRVAVLKIQRDVITINDLDFEKPVDNINSQLLLSKYDNQNSEKAKIVAAIQQTDGNFTRAARLLGISTHTLAIKRKRYGLK